MTNPFKLAATSVIAGASALLLGACGMTFPPPQGGAVTPPPSPVCQFGIATVSEADGQAYIIRSGSFAPVPATPGDRLCAGDSFRTGAGTMKLRTASGGEIEVYEHTDPRIFKEAACFAVSFFHSGRLKITASEFCVNGELKQASTVGYEARGDSLRVWVLEGRVRLLQRPFTTIGAGQQAVVQRGRIVTMRQFSPAEFNRVFPNKGPTIL